MFVGACKASSYDKCPVATHCFSVISLKMFGAGFVTKLPHSFRHVTSDVRGPNIIAVYIFVVHQLPSEMIALYEVPIIISFQKMQIVEAQNQD